jgi:hypothetical protein
MKQKCKYPNCDYPCISLPDCQEQEPIKWSDYEPDGVHHNKPSLAKQEQNPEWMTEDEQTAYTFGWFKALELNPARKPWVGLTDDERNLISRSHAYVDMIIRAAEAKLKEKNT